MPVFTAPSKIIMGRNALTEAKEPLAACGRKALIVTGKHVGCSPMMTSLQRTLREIGLAYAVFDEITGEPTDRMVNSGVAAYRANGCDFVIGIGGGSPLDSAKAIAAMTVNEGEIASYMGKDIQGDIPRIVAIPTTAGTGSEATKFTVITDQDKGVKMLLRGERLIPALAVIDPDFSIDMPKSVTAATGLDALTHAIEAYTSQKAFALTDALALSAVRRIMTYLPRAYANGLDTEARGQMAAAALEAGLCINNSSVTLVHGMSRPIGALFHVSHGLSNAMLLPECLDFALEGAYARFAELGRAIGAAGDGDSEVAAAELFLHQVQALCRTCEVPTPQEYGIDRETFFAAIPKMAADAIASGSPANTRRTVTEADCAAIYRRLF